MQAKHQFKYSFNETNMEEFSPVDITMEMPGDLTLTQMLYNFERYLQACGFVFSGKLDFVEETYPEYLDQIEEEPGYGCMADFDRECGCLGDSMSHKEVVKNNWVHGMCNPPSPDWKKSNEHYDGATSANPKKYSKWLNKLKKKK